MRGGHGVGPHPRRVDAEGAVVVAARHVGLHHEEVRAVHVGCRQRAAGALHRVGLGQRRCAGARDHRRVIGADNCDRDVLRGGTTIPVADRDGVGLDYAAADRQALCGGVVEAVIPGAGSRIDAEATVGAAAIAGVGERVGQIDVGGRDLAADG